MSEEKIETPCVRGEDLYSIIEAAWLNGYQTHAYNPNTMPHEEHRQRNLERYMESIQKEAPFQKQKRKY